jgi:hypothetical protein
VSVTSAWDLLGIAQTRDRMEIRKAYAARLKVVHPEDDPDGFMALRSAYEDALRHPGLVPGSVRPRALRAV